MKYLLDTDVVSQYKKNPPHPRVDAWIRRIDDCDLYISEITFAELWYGVYKLEPGKRRTALEEWIEDELPMQFFNQTLFFNMTAARHYGSIVARAKKRGFTAGAMDAMIAAIAVTNNMAVATLNREHFEPLGIDLVTF